MLLLRPDKELLVLGVIVHGTNRFNRIRDAAGLGDGELDRLLKRLRGQGFVATRVAQTVGKRTFLDYLATPMGAKHYAAAAAGFSAYEKAMRKARLDTSELTPFRDLLASPA